MLITDGPSDTFADIIKHYNHPHMPVRIFTYLIGKDKSSGKNLYQMACDNKGEWRDDLGGLEVRSDRIVFVW